MRKHRRVIFRLKNFSTLCKRRVHVAYFANDFRGLPRSSFQFLPILVGRIILVVGFVPFDLELLLALDGGPSVVGNYGNAAERLEHQRRLKRIECRRLLHAFHRERSLVVDGLHRAAEHRRVGNVCVEHSVHVAVNSVSRFAGYHGFQVVTGGALPDIAPFALRLELQLFFFRDIEFRSRRRQRAVT